jgi:hypothetical protein
VRYQRTLRKTMRATNLDHPARREFQQLAAPAARPARMD